MFRDVQNIIPCFFLIILKKKVCENRSSIVDFMVINMYQNSVQFRESFFIILKIVGGGVHSGPGVHLDKLTLYPRRYFETGVHTGPGDISGKYGIFLLQNILKLSFTND